MRITLTNRFNRKRTFVWLMLLLLLVMAPTIIYATETKPISEASRTKIKPTEATIITAADRLKLNRKRYPFVRWCESWKRRMGNHPHWLVAGENGMELKNTENISEAFAALEDIPFPSQEYVQHLTGLYATLRSKVSISEFKRAWNELNELEGSSCSPFIPHDLFIALANEKSVSETISYKTRYVAKFKEIAMAWIGAAPSGLDILILMEVGREAIEKDIISGVDLSQWRELQLQWESDLEGFRKKARIVSGSTVDVTFQKIIQQELTMYEGIKERLLPMVAALRPKE